MNRHVTFESPYLLGFEHLEKLLERAARTAGDSYPPYNIEELPGDGGALGQAGGIRIALAVAGFSKDELSVTEEDHQLLIRGKQAEPDGKRSFTGASRHENFCAALSCRTESKSAQPRWKMDY